MNFKYLVSLLIGIASVPVSAASNNSFDGITCQTDIVPALIGRHMPNGRVVTIEARYKNIGLKDLGAFGMEIDGHPWTLISWEICGREYALLERHDVVRDAVASPIPSGGPQSQIASCSVNGSVLQGTALAFVDEPDQKLPGPVKNAWLIDGKAVKFVKIAGDEIVCTP
jgi:hypothetical protein